MSQGIQPPLAQDLTTLLGPQLLGHVRTLDATADDEAFDDAVDNAIQCLQKLVALASRQGLLQNDIKMAESLLMASAANSSSQNNAQSKKRRSDDGGDVSSKSNTTLSATLPIQLVMTAVLRILGLKSVDSSAASQADLALLITLAADLIRAVIQHTFFHQQARPLMTNNTPTICTQAEYEWIQGSAKSILSSLGQCMPKLLANLQKQEHGEDSSMETKEALTSCLLASADLIALAGTKLSRSQAILSTLHNTAWDALLSTIIPIHAPATLLAAIPLAGGTDRVTPSSLWTKTFQNVQVLLWMFLQKTVPVSQRIKTREHGSMPATLSARVDEWCVMLQQMESQSNRVVLVLHLIQSLVSVLVELLHLGKSRHVVLLEATLDLPVLLDLVDALLSLPMSAEAVYYGTKKRLREEPLESAVLSSASIANQVANYLYMEGQRLLSCVVKTMGGPSLLPHAHRVRQVGYASVLTVCSPTLRQVLETGYSATKKRRWLPHALQVRSTAIRTLQSIVVSLGVKATSERATTRQRTKGEMDPVIKLVSGCLLEQLYPQGDDCIDWGSGQEQFELIVAASDCLASIMYCGGEFLTMESRQLLESVAATCLSFMTKQMQSSAASSQSANMLESFLELGKACVSTSWPDGAASSLRDMLRHTAQSVAREAWLARHAASALQLCNTLSHPTVPALYVVTRQSEDLPAATAEALTAKIEQARNDSKAQKERQQAEEQKRKKAKLEKAQVKPATTVPSPAVEEKPETTSKDDSSQTKSEKDAEQTSTTNVSKGDEHSPPKKESLKVNVSKDNEHSPPKKESPKVKPNVEPKAVKVDPPKAPPKPNVSNKAAELNDDEESDLDEDFPMIVDAGPDEDDVNEDD